MKKGLAKLVRKHRFLAQFCEVGLLSAVGNNGTRMSGLRQQSTSQRSFNNVSESRGSEKAEHPA